MCTAFNNISGDIHRKKLVNLMSVALLSISISAQVLLLICPKFILLCVKKAGILKQSMLQLCSSTENICMKHHMRNVILSISMIDIHPEKMIRQSFVIAQSLSSHFSFGSESWIQNPNYLPFSALKTAFTAD